MAGIIRKRQDLVKRMKRHFSGTSPTLRAGGMAEGTLQAVVTEPDAGFRQRVGDVIREARRRKGLSQDELGAKVGVRGKQISDWERGRNLPYLDTALKLANALDLSLDDLAGGARNPPVEAAAELDKRLRRVEKALGLRDGDSQRL